MVCCFFSSFHWSTALLILIFKNIKIIHNSHNHFIPKTILHHLTLPLFLFVLFANLHSEWLQNYSIWIQRIRKAANIQQILKATNKIHKKNVSAKFNKIKRKIIFSHIHTIGISISRGTIAAERNFSHPLRSKKKAFGAIKYLIQIGVGKYDGKKFVLALSGFPWTFNKLREAIICIVKAKLDGDY